MIRTQTLFFVSSLVGANLLLDTPLRADEAPPPAAKSKAASKTAKAAKTKPAAKPPVVAPAAPPKEVLCKIDVKIDNLRKNDNAVQGQLCYTLFKGKEGFPDKTDLSIRNECVKVEQSSTLSFAIDKLPCNQDYAIAVLHDENMNRELDKNIAIPKEGVGMSNNPSFIRVNSPPYDDVKFVLPPPSSQQTIRIHYWP